MSGELERCGNIISGLLSFSRQSEIAPKDIDMGWFDSHDKTSTVILKARLVCIEELK